MKLDYSVQKQVANMQSQVDNQKQKNMQAKVSVSKQSVANNAIKFPQQAGGAMAVQQTNDGFGRTS